MPTSVIEGFLYSWKKNQDYAPKLIADLSEEQMVAQPATDPDAPANHPAWVFSHLNVYLPVICSIIRGEAFEDPKTHRFGMLSKPEVSGCVPVKTGIAGRFPGRPRSSCHIVNRR